MAPQPADAAGPQVLTHSWAGLKHGLSDGDRRRHVELATPDQRLGAGGATPAPSVAPSDHNGPHAEGLGLFATRQRTIAVLAFSACSSTMLVFNKLAVQQVRLPAVLISFQMLCAVGVLRLMRWWGVVTLDGMTCDLARAFALPVITFTGSVFSNVNGLQRSNVETFVVFRCSTPIVASLIEGFFMDRHFPRCRSWVAMALVLTGAVAFVASSGTFRVYSQLWVMVWYLFTIADALVLRNFMQSVDMSLWSRAYWYNALALPFFLTMAVVNDELAHIPSIPVNERTAFALGASTLVGFFISYTGFMLRSCVSATSFLVVATVCKVFTVTLSVAIWRDTASVVGLGGLLTCITGGAMYQESPIRMPLTVQATPLSPNRPTYRVPRRMLDYNGPAGAAERSRSNPDTPLDRQGAAGAGSGAGRGAPKSPAPTTEGTGNKNMSGDSPAVPFSRPLPPAMDQLTPTLGYSSGPGGHASGISQSIGEAYAYGRRRTTSPQPVMPAATRSGSL